MIMELPVVETPFSSIMNLLYKSSFPKILNIAVKTGFFESLSRGAKSLSQISQDMATEPHITEALLDVLVSFGFLHYENDQYSLTPISEEYLVKRSPINQLGEIISYSERLSVIDFLEKSLQGDKMVFDHKMWSNEAMSLGMEQGAKAGSMQTVVAFMKRIPGFYDCKNMCDFAGNIGYYSFAILNEHKLLKSTVLDLPEVCQIAKKIKQNESDFDRINFTDFNVATDNNWGFATFDLFFISHFLYQFGAENQLTDFFKKVNHSMKKGGILVSNHGATSLKGDNGNTMAIVELITRLMGYPTHHLPEEKLKKSLSEAGFGEFRIEAPNEAVAFPTLLLAAKKIKDV